MRRRARAGLVVLLVLALVPALAIAQDAKKKKKKTPPATTTETEITLTAAETLPLLNKGAYDEAIALVTAAGDGAGPDALYVEGLAFEGKRAAGDAVAVYQRLAARPEDDTWHWIGESARALANGDAGGAVSAADRAVEVDAANKYAHYQRGRALVVRKDFAASAGSFVRVLEIDGDFAYGHYWAGMSYYQSKNLVAAGNHLTRFLQLAPEAPERLQVQGILATLRGS